MAACVEVTYLRGSGIVHDQHGVSDRVLPCDAATWSRAKIFERVRQAEATVDPLSERRVAVGWIQLHVLIFRETVEFQEPTEVAMPERAGNTLYVLGRQTTRTFEPYGNQFRERRV